MSPLTYLGLHSALKFQHSDFKASELKAAMAHPSPVISPNLPSAYQAYQSSSSKRYTSTPETCTSQEQIDISTTRSTPKPCTRTYALPYSTPPSQASTNTPTSFSAQITKKTKPSSSSKPIFSTNHVSPSHSPGASKKRHQPSVPAHSTVETKTRTCAAASSPRTGPSTIAAPESEPWV